jgi:hypothetical protein
MLNRKGFQVLSTVATTAAVKSENVVPPEVVQQAADVAVREPKPARGHPNNEDRTDRLTHPRFDEQMLQGHLLVYRLPEANVFRNSLSTGQNDYVGRPGV